MQFVSDNLEYLVEGLESAERLIDQVHELVSQAKDGASSTASEWLPRVMRDTGYERFRKQSAGAVRDCRDGCQRVVNIVHAMRQLSHPATDGFHLASLNEIISGAAIVTRNRWKFVADVRLELDPEIPNIPCRAAELSQVFVNMLVNSADALPEPPTGAAVPSGVITISSTLQNDQVSVTVQDNGIGIPAQVIDRIFDPFFTTKPFGKGTGQGLAIAHDIVVNRHRGALCVDSDPNRGTTFTIRLPLVQTHDHTAAEVAWM
jgi:two-component system NtrC family sensor kinase